ncbi:MAG: replication-relaxation family protein, partial [Ktedonobacteraceae bacterium]
MTIRTTQAIKEDYQRILEYLRDHPHATVKDIALDVFGASSPKWCLKASRRIDDLLQQKLVGRYASEVFVGYRSPYIYHLTSTGAKSLGIDRIASQHRHKPSAKHFHHLQTKRELERFAATHAFLLATNQLACKGYLFKYITYI